MKNFRDFLNEAYVNTRKSRPTSKELLELNRDRIGKPVLSTTGKEIPNSLVISYKTFAIKEKGEYRIVTYDLLDNEHTILLTNEEMKLLRKL